MKRVLVVGAGPAGAATALQLSRAGGLEVLLADAATFPRDKICAGGLSVNAQAVLDRLGMLPTVLGEAHRIGRLRLVGPGGEEWRLGQSRSVVLPRRRFDHLMVQGAVRAGAILREGIRAKALLRAGGRVCGIATASGELEADLTIVATGVFVPKNAVVPAPGAPRRLMAVERRFEGFDFDPDAMEMIYAKEVLPGYGWVFPESRVRANVGVCVDEGHAQSGALHAVFADFLATHLGSRMRNARAVDNVRGQPIAWRSKVPDLSEPGALWVGEAAGLTSAATGEGIWHALASGLCAATAIADTLPGGGDPRRAYQRRCARALGLPLLSAAAFSRAATSPLFPRVVKLAGSGLGGRLASAILERL